jgi:signal transduction histidine kinase
MGHTFEQAFPEIWDTIKVVFDEAEKAGVAADVFEQQLFVERNGFVEETYFTGNFNPLRGDYGQVEGFYNSCYEVTRQIITDRRTSMLNRMTVPSGLHRDKSLASCILPFLEMNATDIPMALLYQADKESVPGSCLVHLCGTIGVPEGHTIAVEKADIITPIALIPFLRRARSEIATTNPVNESFEGVQWRGFKEPSKYFSVIPITEAGRLFGFLLVGTNPRRPIDEHHYQFMRDIRTKIGSIAASIVSAEETSKRAERLEKELASSEKQIRFFAQHATVGMQNLSVDGTTVWANNQFYINAGLPRQIDAAEHKLSFIDMVIDEDREEARDAWVRLLNGEPHVSSELRLKKLFTPPSGEPEPACILSTSFPYMEDGKTKSIMTCTTDVSRMKWAETLEARKADEARKAKRQQEEFIDIVSHEMRNPLSAIFQCADLIQSSVANHDEIGNSETLLAALRSNVDAAKTILMCAEHQKRIVDDVLTLSKLEYTMLSISPRPVHLGSMMERVVKMFAADLTSHDIKITTIADSSLENNHIDWVQCDPSRTNQILINLVTNAIKFTVGEPKREITIQYGATLSEPRKSFPQNLYWAANHKQSEDLTLEPEWGNGEPVYLCVQVSDTGVGMTKDEIKKLFTRFEQAGSRTSIKYGGTGLGLFISQRLTEKQGGEIGVTSVPNQGSTFAVYVKARRAEPDHAAIAEQKILSEFQGRTRANSKVFRDPKGVDLSKMHVLLVEDNVVNQKILRKQLTTAGCVVHIANHGVEALEFLPRTDIWHEQNSETKHIDIILMDWEMPIMDGLTCSREIRALQKLGKVTRHIQIIATTANARDEQIQSALASGVVS